MARRASREGEGGGSLDSVEKGRGNLVFGRVARERSAPPDAVDENEDTWIWDGDNVPAPLVHFEAEEDEGDEAPLKRPARRGAKGGGKEGAECE